MKSTASSDISVDSESGYSVHVFVSVNGSDLKGNGSFDSPYRTITAAQKTIRRVIKENGLNMDAYIFIRGGTYYIDQSIEIGINDFDNNYNVVYTNYNDEYVRIVGGIPLKGWKDPGGTGIFETELETDSVFYALYENRKRLIIAKDQNWKNRWIKDKSHLQAVFGSATSWFGEVIKVNNICGDKIELSAVKCDWSGNLQYIQGAREFISQAGEWAIENNKVYLKPFDPATIEESEIIAGVAHNIFDIKGTNEIHVKNIIIRGLNLEMNAFGENLLAHARQNNVTGEYDENLNGIISIANAESISVEHCSIVNAGYVGIVLKEYAQQNLIYGNQIYNTGFAGIFLIGENPGSLNYCNRSNTVCNNRIKNVGEFVGHGAGIYLMNSGENKIIHNDISDIPRYGISMKGIRYGVFGDNGINTTFDDHWKYNQTTGNYIGFNRIYNTGIRSGDGGGIESWGAGRDNHIDNNIIFNAYRGIPTEGWRGHSIFLDDAAHHTVVTNNLIYDENAVAVNAGIFIKSIDNYVVNNVFDASFAKNGAADIAPYICPAGESVFKNNIVYSCSVGKINSDGTISESNENERTMVLFSDDANSSGTPSLESLKEMDNNIYYNAKGKCIFMVNGISLSLEDWKNFKENVNHYDANSICADPLFTDPEKHDYRLNESSPAFKLGFKPIDFESVGLLDDFRFNL